MKNGVIIIAQQKKMFEQQINEQQKGMEEQ